MLLLLRKIFLRIGGAFHQKGHFFSSGISQVEYFTGDRIFERGEDYFKQDRVGDLYLCPKGVISKVRGT